MHTQSGEKKSMGAIARQGPSSPKQNGKLLHELQVHQIELETQNEELRRAQGQLEISRARYLQLYDRAPVGYLTLSGKGLILEANLTAARLIGAQRGDLAGQPLTRFIHRQDQDSYYLHRKILFDEGGLQVCELRLKKKKGDFFWAQIEATITRDPESEATCHVAINDITRRKQVEEALQKAYDTLEQRVRDRTAQLEEANRTLQLESSQRLSAEASLRQSKERYRRITEGLTDYLYTVYVNDNAAVKTVHNQACEAVTGYTVEEFNQNSLLWLSMVPVEDRRLVVDHVQKVLRGGAIRSFEHRIARKDGEVRWVNTTLLPHKDEAGNLISYDGLIKDITRQKAADEKEKEHIQQLQQADKMSSLGVLVSGVAHEINNPNNFIMLNSPILRQAWEDARPILDEYLRLNGDFKIGGINYSRISQKIPQLFSGIENGARRIQRIVADLKNYARRDLSVCDSPVEVNQVVKEAVSLLGNLIAKQTSRFSFTPAPRPVHILGNSQKLEQVVINLVQNSCESLPSPEAPVAIRVYTTRNTCVISISDGGRGISAFDLPKLTDPFFTTKRESGGTGLGLSVSAGIVKEHGGKLEFKSELGKGTVARVILPLQRKKDGA